MSHAAGPRDLGAIRKLVAVGLLVLVVAAVAVTVERWGMWRRAVVHVTGQVAVDLTFSEHSGGLSPQPCRDSVSSGQIPAYALPRWFGYRSAGSHYVYYFGGRTATSDAAHVGRDLVIHRPGTYGVAASMSIDGRGYSFYVGSVTVRADGSGSAMLRGNEGSQPPSRVTIEATVSWSCRDGLFDGA